MQSLKEFDNEPGKPDLTKAMINYLQAEEDKDLCGTPISQIQSNNTEIKSGTICPDCSEILLYSGGCVECPNCGYSKC